MKTLKDILEGVLNTKGALDVSNAHTIMCQTPKVRDFQKNPWGGTQVDWTCPGLIQEYIDILDATVMGTMAKDRVVGFRISIHNKYELTAYLIDDVGAYSAAVELTGIGADGASIPTQKKETIEFFNYIQKNPAELKRLFEYVNKRQEELNKNGMCNCWTLKQILKY